jgi:eukaryotic-like serine/threonine-protein kinase
MRTKIVSLIVCTLLFATTLSVAGPINNNKNTKETAGSPLTVDWWPMYHHDFTRTGFSTSPAPVTNNTLWITLLSSGGFASSPSIVDGKLYVGSTNSDVYCFDAATGTMIWNYTTMPISSIFSSPAVANGKVYIGTGKNMMYCLNANDGTLIWSYQATGTTTKIDSSPAVVNGRVYFGSTNGNVYCLDAAGNPQTHQTTMIWSYSTSTVYGSPAVINDKVYITAGATTGSTKVYCLNATGNSVTHTTTKIWSFSTNGVIYHSTPVVVNNKVYVGSTNGIYCLNATGTGDGNTTMIWRYQNGTMKYFSYNTPAVAYGNVYISSSSDNQLYCLNATGNGNGNTTKIWSYPITTGIYTAPAVADGKVYISGGFASAGTMFCLDARGNSTSHTTTKIWNYSIGSYLGSSPAIADGKIYLGSGSNTRGLFCFRDESAPNIPSVPQGPVHGNVNIIYTYTTNTADPENDQVFYNFSWGDSTNSGWVGPFTSGETVSQNHSWLATGTYPVKVKAKDIYNNESGWSPELSVVITSNHPPNTPAIPSGSTNGIIGMPYTFTTNATDPDGNQVKYGWDWNGDGIVDQWTGYYNSGVTISLNHTFLNLGIFNITVKSNDSAFESGWSPVHSILIKTPANLTIGNITGGWAGFLKGGKVSAELKNTGGSNATQITWNISLSGAGIILAGKQKSGTITSLEEGGTQLITDTPIVGFGNVIITVKASADGIPEMTKTADGFVFIVIVFIK